MNKTLLSNFSEKTDNQAVASETGGTTEQLTDLMKEMRGAWHEAAKDVLQPRKEVLDQLLKKVLH